MLKIKTNKKKKPFKTLLNLSIVCVARNIVSFCDAEYMESFPNSIKSSLIYYIDKFRGEYDDILLKLLLNKDIKQLDLSASKITDMTLKLIAEKSRNITELTLSKGIYSFTKEGLLKYLPQLQRLRLLKLSNSDQVDDEVAIAVAKHCQYLELLDMSDCKNIGDDTVSVVKDLKLTGLNLSKTEITDQSLEYLANGICSNSLADLSINYCHNVTSDGLNKLKWENIKYVGFIGIETDNLHFDLYNGTLRFMQWSIDI